MPQPKTPRPIRPPAARTTDPPPPAPYVLPRNLSDPHEAEMPGYEAFAAVYNMSISILDADGFTNWLDEAAAKIDHFTAWPLDAPAPTADDKMSFRAVPFDLLKWMCKIGWRRATEDALKNV